MRGSASPSEGRREPLRGVRRVIAEHMARAHREVPAVTWVEECDFSGMDLKQLVPSVLKACAEALKEFPELNARLERDEIVFLDRYDLGVAVQTDDGLVVPVVRDCAKRSVEDLGADVARLAESARAGTLKPEELRGSTFTVTSAGKLGGLLQTPIVNHPEVAILSIGRICAETGRARRRGRRRANRLRVDHVRPSRHRRGPRGRVRARRHLQARTGIRRRPAEEAGRLLDLSCAGRPRSTVRGSLRPATCPCAGSRTPCRRRSPAPARRTRRCRCPESELPCCGNRR